MIEICIRFARSAIMHRRAIEGVRKKQRGVWGGKGGYGNCCVERVGCRTRRSNPWTAEMEE